jgi:CubicO group peptidase (beta-lactamase class C family)
MTRISLIALLALALSSSGLLAAELQRAKPESVGMSSSKLAAVNRIVNKLISDQKLAGATVAITRHGKVVHFNSYGQADRAAGKPWKNDTVVRIYSMSKAITTAAAMMLHEEAKFQLDDPISQYIPEFDGVRVLADGQQIAPQRPITVRDLMRHTSGLTYGAFGNTPVDKAYRKAGVLDQDSDLAGMAGKIAKLPLVFHPGAKFNYSVSTDLLGRLVEIWSGQRFDRFLKQRIFTPLDMKDTGFQVRPQKVERLANVYSPAGKGKLRVAETARGSEFLTKPKLLSGGGGLISTTRDYLHFLQMIANGGELFGKRLLQRETVALMTRNHIPDEAMPIGIGNKRPGVGFGLGFSVRTEMSEWDPQGRVGEYGWGGMASTHYWVSPKDNLVVVTMEQTLPYSFLLEFALKGKIYDALID